MRKFLKKIVKRVTLGSRYSSETYIKHLIARGCSIGKGTKLFSPETTIIDETRPWLINIGKNVQITAGVTILTHGYDWSVIKGKYGDILGSSGKVSIGDNVFIGVNTTILKGVTIGNNVIIGANSLVNKDVIDDVVVAGNPAKVICALDEYYKKRKELQLREAVELALEHYRRYKEWPSKKVMREFIFLFEGEKEDAGNDEIFGEIGALGGNFDQTLERLVSTKRRFGSYDDFMDYCRKEFEKSEKQ